MVTSMYMSTSISTPAFENPIDRVIGCAVAVHRELGPGLPQTAYHECLARELDAARLSYARDLRLPIVYRGQPIDFAHSIDFLVERRVVLSVLAVDGIKPSHNARLAHHMKLVGAREGLLLNFHAPILIRGLRRRA